MIKTADARPKDRLTLFFRRGTDSRRALYARARRAMSPQVSSRGRRLAQESAQQATFTIPRSSGFAVLPPTQFDDVGNVVTAAQQLLAGFDRSRPVKRDQKRYRINLLKPKEITLDSAFIRFALRPDLLAGVATYLEVAPVLTDLQVWYSPPRSEEPQGSQLYHCDFEDTTQIKVFILCTEVGAENGPLTFLSADTSSMVRRTLHYEFEGKNRFTDEQVYSVVSEDDRHLATGPAGTTCFLDVSRCLHYGSRVADSADGRLVVMIQFMTPFSFTLPRDVSRALPFRRLANSSLTPLARAVLDGEYKG